MSTIKEMPTKIVATTKSRIEAKKTEEIKNKAILITQAIENKIDRIIIGVLGCLVIALVGIIITFLFLGKSEREQWYKSHFYIYSRVETKAVMTTSERKQKFQMKIIGLMKDMKTNITDDEMMRFTEFVFEKSEEYNWDPYIAIGVAWNESNFDKYALGSYSDSGLFQFLPTTARMIAPSTGVTYYRNMEFNPIDSAKLWFAYMKILVDRFNGNIQYALLAYNMGERRLMETAGIKRMQNGLLNTDDGNLDNARKTIYYKNGKKLAYDEKVLRFVEYIKMKGTRDDIPLEKFFEMEDKRIKKETKEENIKT